MSRKYVPVLVVGRNSGNYFIPYVVGYEVVANDMYFPPQPRILYTRVEAVASYWF